MLAKFVCVVLWFASAIHGLILVSPPPGSTLVSGHYVILNVVISQTESNVDSATILFAGQNGAIASTAIEANYFGANVPFMLPATFSSGVATVTATPVALVGPVVNPDIAINVVSVVAAAAPVPVLPIYPYPCNNNAICNPCHKPVCNFRNSRCSNRKTVH